MQQKKKIKGLSIFQKIFISYLFIGFSVLAVALAIYFIRERSTIQHNLKIEFGTHLRSSLYYFDRAYASRIYDDLSIMEISPTINDYLSSKKEDILLNKTRTEQIFLHFTSRKANIYLSMRLINHAGKLNMVTVGL